MDKSEEVIPFISKSINASIDKFLRDVGLERPPSASKHPHIPAIGGWNDTDKKYWMDLYKKLSNFNMLH